MPCLAWTKASVETLASDQLEALCGTSCRDDLTSLRTSIIGACKGPNDVVVPGESVTYPATYLADRFLYATSLSCLRDKATDQYCDIIVAGWNGSYTDAEKCSMCELEIQRLQLSSPFGYSEDGAEDFSSLTSSCKETTYTYATPTSYALNSTTAPPAPTCATPYVIKEGDTCVTISGENGVSTFNLIMDNAIDSQCNLLPAAGKSLCLPRKCNTHQLDMGETCDSLVRDLNITRAQLHAWNPNINYGCTNLAAWRGWYLCASSPSPTVPVNEGGSTTTPAPIPSDAQGESNTNCSKWYFVESGDHCAKISLQFSISLKDFYFLNPQVDGNCTNLWGNTSYCVQPIGDIATYPGYPVDTPSTTFPKPPPPTSFVPTPVETPALNPTAPGTIEGCFMYENALNEKAGVADLASGNSCQSWAWAGDVTVDELIEWNPSLVRDNCVLDAQYSYCIRRWEEKPKDSFPYDYCMSPNANYIPSDSTQPSDCTCYVQFRAADKEVFKCSSFPDLFGITVADVQALNPWIGSDCDTDLWSKLSPDGFVQLCVSQESSKPSSSSMSPTPTPTATATASN
ncbi:hypothetical protein FQN55_005736 [Onygenales sp. PD_40]|nr:hypothetical protein FQN55_005736 [Onygenales sp. PD_40]